MQTNPRASNLGAPRLHTSVTGPNSLQLLHLGAVAQLGEHLPCTQGVVGSNPIRSIPYPGSTANGGHDIPSDSAAAGYNNGGGPIQPIPPPFSLTLSFPFFPS